MVITACSKVIKSLSQNLAGGCQRQRKLAFSNVLANGFETCNKRPGRLPALVLLAFGIFTTGVAMSQEPDVISQLAWELKSVSSYHPNFKKMGDYAFDGQPGTLWESALETPATLEIDLGHVYDLSGFAYLPRQEGPWGRIKEYEFSVSSDGSAWDVPVSVGELPSGREVKKVHFPTPKTGRYIRLRGITSHLGKGISAAELNVIGTLSDLNVQPVVAITSPVRYFPGVHVYEPADFSIRAIASKIKGKDPVQVSFYDKEKLLGTDDQSPFSWDVATATAGVYELTAKAKYSDDTEITSLAVQMEIRSAANGVPMDRSNWQLQHVDSWKENTDVGQSPGQNAFDNNPFTWWVTEWEPPNTVDYPHAIEIDMGKQCSIGGFLVLPPQDPGTWGTVKDYEFFTSTDGHSWGTAVAKGTFVYPTAYMQEEQTAHFPLVEARYVKLKILSGYNAANQVLRIAEIHVLEQAEAASKSDHSPANSQ